MRSMSGGSPPLSPAAVSRSTAASLGVTPSAGTNDLRSFYWNRPERMGTCNYSAGTKHRRVPYGRRPSRRRLPRRGQTPVRRCLRLSQRVRCVGLLLAYLAVPLSCLSPSEASAGERREIGLASYYFRGQRIASGEAFDKNGFTGAYRTIRFGTSVCAVTGARLNTNASGAMRSNSAARWLRVDWTQSGSAVEVGR